MLSNFTKSIALRQIKIFLNKNKYLVSAYRTPLNQEGRQKSPYRQRKEIIGNRKLFTNQQLGRKQNKNRQIQDNQNNIEEYVKTINQINKEFLGIKVNTDYFKVYNQKSFQEACKPDKSQLFRINDLPFQLRSKSNTVEQSSSSTSTLQTTTASKILTKMISEQRLTKELQNLAKSYFNDLVSKQRNSRIQANFEWYSRKVVQTLKSSKWQFRLQKNNEQPNVKITNVSILKGVKVNRNDNYTIDSYKVDLQEESQGVTTYTLWKKQNENYPQEQWFAQKFIVARIQAEVSNGPVLEVTQQNSNQTSNKGLKHSFVFEANLTVPPTLSFLSLSPQQYSNSYRLKPQNIQITNVDNRNIWFNIAYKQEQKKFKLINKLI